MILKDVEMNKEEKRKLRSVMIDGLCESNSAIKPAYTTSVAPMHNCVNKTLLVEFLNLLRFYLTLPLATATSERTSSVLRRTMKHHEARMSKMPSFTLLQFDYGTPLLKTFWKI